MSHALVVTSIRPGGLFVAGKTNEQAKVFRNLLQRATARHMKWLVQIILKNLRVRAG